MTQLQHESENVVVVGAGIVGLVCGLYLNIAGYKVTFVDSGPNPLRSNYSKNMSGATFSGGNARHVSVTETSPWASSSMSMILDIKSSEGGWFAKSSNNLANGERQWINEFYQLTRNPNLYEVFFNDVIWANTRGKILWRKLMTENPSIFEETGFADPLSIFFLNKASMDSEVRTENNVNKTPNKLLSRKDISNAFHPLALACKENLIVGGLIVDGFALNAISLSQNIIGYLKGLGAEFYWGESLIEIHFEETGTVSHILTNKGRVLRNRNFVVSTGVGTPNLFRATRSFQKILGVAGVWISLPNPGISAPFKIDAPRPTGFINATIESDRVLFSGGYGFIGTERLSIRSTGIRALFTYMESTVASLFPDSYEKAKSTNTLDRRACARPSTATGLGVFEAINTTAGGKLLIVGGNCAGGFTQAPVIGEAVLAALQGQAHKMHEIYDPSRIVARYI